MSEEYLDTAMYYVSSATIKRTKNGHELFSLILNNSIEARKFIPYRKSDQSWCEIFQIYKKLGNINNLAGNYIICGLTKNKYGYNIHSIDDIDYITTLKNDLEKHQSDNYFFTSFTYYEFLKKLKSREVTSEGFIRLKPPYDFFYATRGLIFRKDIGENTFNFSNADDIFNQFYKGREPEGDIFNSYKYRLHCAAEITLEREHTSDRIKGFRTSSQVILGYGDNLSESQIEYLNR